MTASSPPTRPAKAPGQLDSAGTTASAADTQRTYSRSHTAHTALGGTRCTITAPNCVQQPTDGGMAGLIKFVA